MGRGGGTSSRTPAITSSARPRARRASFKTPAREAPGLAFFAIPFAITLAVSSRWATVARAIKSRARAPGESTGNYLGRQYLAFGVGYEFSPLLSARLLPIANLTDGSYLLALYTLYSLSDESELSFSFSMPIGRKPDAGGIKSEYGLYPASAGLEARFYF